MVGNPKVQESDLYMRVLFAQFTIQEKFAPVVEPVMRMIGGELVEVPLESPLIWEKTYSMTSWARGTSARYL